MNFLLLQINDALFPIGNYTHSFGLESYVQSGRIKNKYDAKDYLKAYLHTQVLHTDLLAIKLIQQSHSLEEILEIESIIAAASVAKQVKSAIQKLGARFIKTIQAMKLQQNALFQSYTQASIHHIYAVAYGVFCTSYQLNEQECIQHYLYAQASHTLTNCVKLIPLAQSDGQEILASLHEEFFILCQKLTSLTKQDLCNSAIASDIKAMQHQYLHTRLYMS
ncbi:urease accessory protein UreF [Helicobacter sp. MIT 21-1697]|uniref:urease accessory protein UreF n=1 Tax=Helicobacter sp. MIT 21-1697 TaxID=2993733 RepID=UPI00224A978C|nr:urease accessory UreF family protein [Helicobacter sp. MIT 21-1697]MCX2716439.1 urease accessory protein UreF [Helicobacter sp. MIT 21-1697]